MPEVIRFGYHGAALQVCVDKNEQGRLSGWVASGRLKEPLPFSDMGHLILQMESVFEFQNFPQAFQRTRSFTADKKGPCSVPQAAESSEDGMSIEAVSAHSGALGCFTVRVNSRRNATWQGLVCFGQGEPEQPFESDLDLIHLAQAHFDKML